MSSLQRGAFALYRYLVALFAAACVFQIFLAGRGVFGMRASVTGQTVDKWFEHQKSLDPHRAFGEIIGLIAVLMFLAALVVWRDRRLIGWTFGLAVATEILQHEHRGADPPVGRGAASGLRRRDPRLGPLARA